MELHSKDKGYISRRLKAIGIPGELREPYFRLVLGWIEGSGLEWTVSRLKAIRVDFLRKKAGLSKSSTWIRSGKGSLWFGGPIGALESWAFDSDIHFRKALTALGLYTSFISSEVTYSQGKKFVSGVAASAANIPPSLLETIRLGFQLSGLRPRSRKLPSPKPLLAYNPSPSKRGPTPWGSLPEEEAVIDSLEFLSLEGGPAHCLRFFDIYLPALEGLDPEKDWVLRKFTNWGMRSSPLPPSDSLYVGRIGLIQEPGFKLRAVANPGRIFQCVLEPLGNELFRSLKDLPWDCTFKQDKADAAIRSSLLSGQKVYSVDLSGATDHFPLELQEEALRLLLPASSNFVDLFIEISRGWWSVPKSFPKDLLAEHGFSTRIQWTKGQPLGLFPSFASFALTHGLLLLGLLGREYHGEFYILGDDVVILDSMLYMKYREALRVMECPVSESKTLESGQVAEFRSVVFLPYDTIPQYKWRIPSDDSFLDILRLFPQLYPLLKPRQRKVVDLISGLPVELGGLGWNPKGLPLSVRLSPFMPLLTSSYEPLDRLMGYTMQVRNLLYKSKLSKLVGSFVSTSERKSIESDLDQRSKNLIRKTFGGTLVPLYEILGKNLDLVLDGNIDLPVQGARYLSHRSRLMQWESTLANLNLLSGE
jgi:hypothetical protein